MAAADLMLCVDIGASSIKGVEFSYTPEGEMLMERFAFVEYGETAHASPDAAPAAAEEDMHARLLEALSRLLKENNFQAKKVCLSLSGHDAYIRFVKVPSMVNDEKKINQIIEFEAKSAIPYDMSEVVWDFQLLNVADDSGEIEAMFVIVKSEEIEQISSVVEALGMRIDFIEVSATACYNAARLNGIGEEACELILNIGDRCSSLLFVDKKRLFVRVIPIAGHAITLQISKEFGISYKEAEEMKRRHGFVALGGAYEEPDSEVAATVSKIVRNIMTRLHGEISRSINIYRSQQKGRRPEKIYLAGGSSVMGYTPRFFEEKLKIPVEYFNPFRNIAIAEGINKERLADIAHTFSEPVGLALRHYASCPVEISLVPQSIRKYNEFKAKMPYFYASAATLLLCLLVTFFGFAKQEEIAQKKQDVAVKVLTGTKNRVDQLKAAESELNAVKSEYQAASTLLGKRAQWPELLNEMQAVLPDHVWLTRFELSGQAAMQKSGPAGPPDEGGGLFGPGFGERTRTPVHEVKDYVAVNLEGCGRVFSNSKDDAFGEIFARRLSKSKYFKFDMNKDSISNLSHDLFQFHNGECRECNIADFKFLLNMNNVIKR